MKQTADNETRTPRPVSLQARLAWRLGGVLVVSMSLVVITLVSYFWITLGELDDASLQGQAQQITRHLTQGGEGLSLSLPEAVANAYQEAGDGFLYAIKDRSGRVVIASSEKARRLIALVSPPQGMPYYFRLPSPSGGDSPYYSLAIGLPGYPGHTLFVAQGHIHDDVYFDTVVAEFVEHVGWILPLILLAALAIAVWTIRTSLTPLKAISAQASDIGPHRTDIRLSLDNIPNEIQPLVLAINGALTRLDEGFLLQRQFTANAAHELRTPLAILNARLDELDASDTAAMLGVDIQRMNRLVEQLLRVSRLDAKDMTLDDEVDLNVLGAKIVGYLAPLAIAEGQNLSLSRATAPVIVRGNAIALGDALRNLVENAIQHSPAGGEILTEISAQGAVIVRDKGPGIADGDKPHIFQRFWRGKSRSEFGSGLGLAIVKETAEAHGGSIAVEDDPGGGTAFILSLPLAP